MKVNRIRLQPYKIYFKDNFNIRVYINNDLLFEITNGFYKFYDKITMIRFMYALGVKCQCERKIVKGKLDYYYFNNKLESYQKEFLQKRAITLMNQYDMNFKGIITHDCGCKKEKR